MDRINDKKRKKRTNRRKGKKEKKGHSETREVEVFINEQEAAKIVGSAKVITVQELARQTNVKISTANAFLKKSLADGAVRKVGGFSGHFIYQPVSQ